MRYLIIGNGAAGVSAAETIRANDPTGEIIIIGAEPYPMYSRPGLAYVLMNEVPWKQVMARRPEWYQRLQLTLVHGRVTHLDTAGKRVKLKNGRLISYDQLLIATGARAVPAPYPGADLKGVVYLDTLDGTRELRSQAKRGRKAVVIGGGITALELSEGLAANHVRTHYLLRRDRLWSAVFNDDEGQLLEEKIRSHGVKIHYHSELSEILGKRGKVNAVRLTNGEIIRCDLVGIGIGVRAQLEMVQNTPIKVDRAILVDQFMRTNIPHIYAAGDCAQVYDPWSETYNLDVLWPSAVAEGQAAGLNMTGHEHPYTKGIPFNACLLFGMHITVMGQINPRSDEADGELNVVQHLSRGSSELWYTYPRQYSSAWSKDGVNTVRLVLDGDFLVGALVIGDQALADPLRTVIQSRVNVSEILPQLKQGGSPMKAALEKLWIGIEAAEAGDNHSFGGS